MSHIKQTASLLVVLLACGASLPAPCQTLDALHSAFILEDRLLERENNHYIDARDRDRQALQQLTQLCARMDQALADENVPVYELRNLESELRIARETAMELLRASARHRENMFDHIDKLEQLGEDIEFEKDRGLVEIDQLDGLWKIEATTNFAGTFGLLKLSMNGTTIQGTYRLSNGAQGSVRGSLVDDKVRMTRMDSKRGDDLFLEGELDRSSGEIYGTWQSKVIGTGRPENGDWTARKLSPGEEQEAIEELRQ